MTLLDLYKLNFDIVDSIAMKQHYWNEGEVFVMSKPRPTNAFLYMSDCKAVCNIKTGEILEIPTGSIIFIPCGREYSFTFSSVNSDAPKTELFEFNVVVSGEQIRPENDFFVISPDRASKLSEYFSRLISEQSKPFIVPTLVKIRTYELFFAILEQMNDINLLSSEFCTISKGIEYLNSNEKQEKSISELAQMCFVSVNYFEKLFKRYSGMTPAKYRIYKKIERAKLLLKSGRMTIDQISAELNFYDASHFCRSFSSVTGMTPREFMKG